MNAPSRPIKAAARLSSMGFPLDFVPHDATDLALCLQDPEWRLYSGHLYKIIVKEADAVEGKVLPFKPNRAQRKFLRSIWNRNIILKSRQLGYTTLICILWLDHALFNPDQRCAIVAHDLDSAQAIFRDKVKFAYDHLPAELRAGMPLVTDSKTELLFSHNNSSVKVATSVRSGTIDRLLVSEFGKMAAKTPEKANEVITGSLPAVPISGCAIIESTAEGQGGAFYDMCKIAEELQQSGKELTPRDWRFHFAAWHDNPEYRMNPKGVVITPKDHQYFDGLAPYAIRPLDLEQRAWYVATRSSDFAGQPDRMWSEYCSTPKEAFQQSTEGTYYAVQLAHARMTGRISTVPHVSNVPVNTFWDIGANDGTAIWCHQKIGAEHRFIKFLEWWDIPYSTAIRALQETGWLWGRHFLPHDADHTRQQKDRNVAPVEMLRELAPGWKFEIVPRVDEIQHGIQMVRAVFSQCWFDETNCAEGIAHLGLYRKQWNDRLAVWSEEPRKDEHTEAADSFRQFAQGWKEFAVTAGSFPNRRNRSGLAA